MNSVLYINSVIKECGVYQYGKRVFDIIQQSTKYNFLYFEVESDDQYKKILSEHKFIAVLYNYHPSTLSWLNNSNIQKQKKNICIFHECNTNLFDIIIEPNPNVIESSTYFGLPRPIYSGYSLKSLNPSCESLQNFLAIGKDSDTPIFGSFGFGFLNKGFHKIISYIQEHYEKAIIKIIVPKAFYSSEHDHHSALIACKSQIIKDGIILQIYDKFVTNEDLLLFLSSTTANLFLYDEMNGRGISSATDYAISVNTPFVISNSYMFRHIYKDDICISKNNMSHCIEASKTYLPELQKMYSHTNFIQKMETIIEICT
jgi:hypothetical protein